MNFKYEFNTLLIGNSEIKRIDTLNIRYWNHVITVLDRYPSIEVSVLGYLQKGNFGNIVLLYHFQTEDSTIANQLNALMKKYYLYIPVHIPAELLPSLPMRKNPYKASH